MFGAKNLTGVFLTGKAVFSAGRPLAIFLYESFKTCIMLPSYFNSALNIFLISESKDQQSLFISAIKKVLPKAVTEVLPEKTDVLDQLYTRETAPDIILMNINADKSRRTEDLIRIKQDEFFFGIPVVVFSAKGIIKEKQQLLGQGASNCYCLPANPAEAELQIGRAIKNIPKKELLLKQDK
jgi:CheY-like chemotaxis protein